MNNPVTLGKFTQIFRWKRKADCFFIRRLPAVPEFVKNIDIEARKILVTPIEGMFTEAVNGDED